MSVLTSRLLLFQINVLRADSEEEERSKDEVLPVDESKQIYILNSFL